MIGATGLNYCNGIAFDASGRLFAACETAGDAVIATNEIGTGTPGIAELDPATGKVMNFIPHGASNYISDITIDDVSGVLYSYENLDNDILNSHSPDGLWAIPVGETMIEGNFHAISDWVNDNLYVAANIDGPKLYAIDPQTGKATLKTELSFAKGVMAASSGTGTTRVPSNMLVDLEFVAMDKLVFTPQESDLELNEALASNSGVLANAFTEEEAEFMAITVSWVIIAEDDEAEISSNVAQPGAIYRVALIDADQGLVGHIVPIETNMVVKGIAIRQRNPDTVPTLSEWGFIIMAMLLFASAVVFLKRRALVG